MVVNHISFLDGALLMAALSEIPVFAINTAMANRWWLRPFRRVANLYPLDPTNPLAVKELIGKINAGQPCVIFPEGRLTRDPNQWPEKAKTGAVRLALHTGAPIVPVAIEGAYRVVKRRKVLTGLIKNLILRPKVKTAIGEPIDVRALLAGEETPAEVRRLTDYVMSKLIDLVEELRGEQSPAESGVDRAPD